VDQTTATVQIRLGTAGHGQVFLLCRSEMFALVFVDIVQGVSPSQMLITLAESSMVRIRVRVRE
jgi:hypothetical protein